MADAPTTEIARLFPLQGQWAEALWTPFPPMKHPLRMYRDWRDT